MRTLFALAVLIGLALSGASQVVTTSSRKVSWGWGCGGNCAVNVSGESETSLGNDPPGVHLEDHGTRTQTQNDPDSILVIATRWNYTFHGASTAGSTRREFDLSTDVSECTRTVETMEAGKAKTEKKTACPRPPKRWKLACERRELQVKGRPRPAWVCSPSEPIDAFGTEFPWVFGVEGPITTVVSGEPQPHTTYE